jgi:hypothetical protein
LVSDIFRDKYFEELTDYWYSAQADFLCKIHPTTTTTTTTKYITIE